MRFSALRRFVSAVTACAVMLTVTLFMQTKEDNVLAAGDGPDLSAYADEIIVLLNEERERLGVEPLRAVPVLNEVGMMRARETVELFDHYRPDGSLFNTALDEYGVSYGNAAENIAAGNSTPEATFGQWMNSSGHYGNMTSADYTHIGVGVCYAEGTKYGWYWEQIFISSDEEFDDEYIPQKHEVTPVSSGDLNGDGDVSSLDLVVMRQKLAKTKDLNAKQIESADCMKDGVITRADAVVLTGYIEKVYDTLPYVL